MLSDIHSLCLQIRSVKIHSCRDLLIGLDLSGLNPTKVPFTMVHSRKITLDFITFDKTFAGNQKLVTTFRNVETVGFQGLHVDEAIEVSNLFYFPLSCENCLMMKVTRPFIILTDL